MTSKRSSNGSSAFDLGSVSCEGSGKIMAPPGFIKGFNLSKSAHENPKDAAMIRAGDKAESIERRAKAIAFAPGKNLFMTGFMLWMSGSTVHIFSMMFTMMALRTPVTAVMNLNKAFRSIDDGTVDLLKWKLLFVAVNLVGLSMALYKCNALGLLPLKASDWVALLPVKESEHWSGGGVL